MKEQQKLEQQQPMLMNDKDRLMRREAQSSQLRNQRNDSKTQHLQKMTQEQNGKFYILKIRNIWISSIYNNSIQSRTVYLTLQLIPNPIRDLISIFLL